MKKLPPLQIAVHAIGILPLVRMLVAIFTDSLTINPIQDLEQRTGFAAVTLLILSLATTPLRTAFNWRQPTKHRRALGLYAFLYAFLHVSIYVAIDYGFNLNLLLADTFEKRYTLVGSIAFVLLLALAVTSFNYWMRKLGKNWKRLHKAVYLAAPLVIIHFAWARKGDIFTLQGDVLQPLIYGLIVLILLGLRIPAIKNLFTKKKKRNAPA